MILPYCRYIQDEVRLTINDGFIDKVEGGLDAKLMHDWLDDNRAGPDDRDPYAVSPPGLGPEPRRHCGTASPLMAMNRSRSRAARAHFSPATSSCSQPVPITRAAVKRTTRGHYDVPMRDCTMELDGRIIIENGKIIDDNMIVERIIHT